MGKIDDLYISVPSFFRCPISLDVMKSPVSLCTGVTYDRTSIQRWLENGNNTCPATMQVLENKYFVPNYTLQRLIQIWSNNNNKQTESLQFNSVSSAFVSDLIQRLIIIQENDVEKDDNNSVFLFESFVKIFCFASEAPENRRFLAKNESFVEYLIRVVCGFERGPGCFNPDLLEAGLKILQLVVSEDEKDAKERVKKVLSSCDLVGILTRIVKSGRQGSKVAAAGIIETFAHDPDLKKQVFDQQELVFELLQVLKQGGKRTSDDGEIRHDQTRAVLSCLVSLTCTRTNRKKLVRAGGVKIIGEMMISPPYNTNTNKHAHIIELLLTLLETLAGSTDGRGAINDEQNIIPMIINKLMKVSKAANEHGVALLWSLCYLFRDQRAKEGVMRSNGGLTKILLLMQSDCSPAVKKMCCDLLRIFRVNSKSCLPSYDTKTTHIMPC